MGGIVDDPSEWPMEFIELKRIDNLLRCSICFEFFNIAMTVPSCSHNYCSFCIRKHISYKECCPTCNLPLIDGDLKCNRVLDEIVKHFKPIRAILIDLVKWCLKSGFKYPTLENKEPNADTNDEYHSTDECEFEILPTFRSPNNMHNKTRKIESKMSSAGDSSQQGMGACPICHIKVPIERINIHLDNCLLLEQDTTQRPSSSVQQIKRMIPIPKTCLNTLKYKELQSKAKVYGLSADGNRNQLVKRIEQFILQYNSQCDAPNPLTSSMVAKQTNENEKTLLKHGYSPGIVIHPHDLRYTSKDREDFNKKYAKENEKQFKELIEKIKERHSEKLSTGNKDKIVSDKCKMNDIERIEITDTSPEKTKNCIEINNHSAFCLQNISAKNDSSIVKPVCVKTVDKPKKKLNTTTKKKHTVRSRNIGSFFKASSNTIIEDENIETTVQLKDNINIKSNILPSIAEETPMKMDESNADFQFDDVGIDNKNYLIVLDDDSDEIMPCTSQTLTPQSCALNVQEKVIFPTKLYGYNAMNMFNSTIIDLPVKKNHVEPLSIDDDLSPVVCKKINNLRDKSCSNRSKRPASYSSESRLSCIPEKYPRMSNYPIEENKLWHESDDSTNSHDSELSAEINNLVEKAIANPLSVSSDSENSESLFHDIITNEISETEDLSDNEIVIPMPPTDINFTQLESQ